jgi:outer membrane lipoprotein-sorting protein
MMRLSLSRFAPLAALLCLGLIGLSPSLAQGEASGEAQGEVSGEAQGENQDTVENETASEPPPRGAEAVKTLTGPERDEALERVEAYFENLKTVRGRFLQYAPDGSASEGEFALKRPGRARFDYDPPTQLTVVADGSFVAVADGELGTVERVPLSSTPLKVLLEEDLNLKEDVAVQSVRRTDGLLGVTVTDPEAELEGELTLIFTLPALELRQWIVTDPAGRETVVTLSQVVTGVDLDPRLFRAPEPEQGEEGFFDDDGF